MSSWIGLFSGLLFNLIFGVLSSLGYQLALLAVLKLCPHSFTFGEASVITQSGILFLSSTIANFGIERTESCMQISTVILQVFFFFFVYVLFD